MDRGAASVETGLSAGEVDLLPGEAEAEIGSQRLTVQITYVLIEGLEVLVATRR
jgi:hypothetical protein